MSHTLTAIFDVEVHNEEGDDIGLVRQVLSKSVEPGEYADGEVDLVSEEVLEQRENIDMESDFIQNQISIEVARRMKTDKHSVWTRRRNY